MIEKLHLLAMLFKLPIIYIYRVSLGTLQKRNGRIPEHKRIVLQTRHGFMSRTNLYPLSLESQTRIPNHSTAADCRLFNTLGLVVGIASELL